jgi:hypothetical protein
MINNIIRTTKIILSNNKKGMAGILKIFLIGTLIIIALFVFIMCSTIAPPQTTKP